MKETEEGKIARIVDEIGALVFVKTDRRVYRRDDKGHATGPLIDRYQYEVRKIVGETRVSWLLAESPSFEGASRYLEKVPKRWHPAVPRFFGRDEVEERLWTGVHRYRLARAIEQPGVDYSMLRRIAEVVGYQEGAAE